MRARPLDGNVTLLGPCKEVVVGREVQYYRMPTEICFKRLHEETSTVSNIQP